MKKVILSVIILVALTAMVEAAPFQTLGMLRTPDAYVLPHKSAEILLVGYYRDVVAPAYVDPDKNGFIPYGMLGVGLFDRVELGLFGGDSVYYMNLKLKLIQETLRIPQIAIGMDNMFSPVNRHRANDYTPATDPGWEFSDHPDKTDYEYYSPYIVGSKQVVFGGLNWMFNLGWGANRYIGQVSRSRIFNGTFASIELSPLKNLSLQGEFDGKDFNAGIKYSIKNFGFKVGAEAVEDWAKSGNSSDYKDNLRIAFGVSYLFDKYAESQRRPNIRQLALVDDTGDLVVSNDDVVIDDSVPIVTPDVVVTPVDDQSTEVAVVTPPTGTLESPGVITQASAYRELSPEVKDLLEELRKLREERLKAQKALEDLRKWLQEQKK